MAGFNRVVLLGNLTRDPQMKYLPSQTAVAEFGLACNRRFKGQNGEQKDEVTFVDCTAFGRSAEVINEYCRKGKQLLIEGRLKFDQWEDKNGGGKRSKLSVVVENFQLLGGRDGAAPGGGPDASNSDVPSGRASAPAPASKAPAAPPFGDEQQFKEDDIPF